MESKIKNENYLVIQGWMINELKLRGNDLLVYAIIYGFSQAEGNVFTGGLRYLIDWTGSTKQGVIKNLKSLVESNLIIRIEKQIHNIKVFHYTVNLEVVNSVYQWSTQFTSGQHSLPVVNSVDGGGQLSLPNNIIDRKIDSINNTRACVREELERSIRYHDTLEYISKSPFESKEAYLQIYQSVTKTLFDACTSNQVYKLNGNMYTSKQLYEIFRELTDDDILSVVNSILSVEKTIKNVQAYILTALLNEPNLKSVKDNIAISQAKRDIENQGGNEE